MPYLPIYNGRVDIGVPDGSGILHSICAPADCLQHLQVDRARVLAVSPNAVWLETDPNNADTDADGITDGNEDANRNGIVDLAIIDRNQTDTNGNFVVLATFTISSRASRSPAPLRARPRRPLSIPISVPPTSSRPTARPTPLRALDKTKLDTFFRPAAPFAPTSLTSSGSRPIRAATAHPATRCPTVGRCKTISIRSMTE